MATPERRGRVVVKAQPGTEAPDSEHFVRSLDRGLTVLKAFSADAPEQSLSDVARRTGLSRASAGRFLHTLVELGYLETSGRVFRVRPRVLDLGFAYLTSLSLAEVVHPYLVDLSDQFARSTSLGVLDGLDVVYLDRIARRRILGVGIQIGMRLPAFVTSQGRMLLACLPPEQREQHLARIDLEPRTASTVRTLDALRERLAEAEAQGWCLVDSELGEGITSLSVPVRDAHGVVVAAVNVAELSTEPGPRLDEIALGPLRATVADIEADLRLVGLRA